jgi:hypothetical protein
MAATTKDGAWPRSVTPATVCRALSTPDRSGRTPAGMFELTLLTAGLDSQIWWWRVSAQQTIDAMAALRGGLRLVRPAQLMAREKEDTE